jgi:endonuclease YncB( thermonuclease family)
MAMNQPARTAVSLCLAAAVALVPGRPAAAQVIVDGDTIELKGAAFRLHGIDAPELQQVCADGWPAGRAARDYLTDLIGSKEVTCTVRMGELDHEIAAICRANGIDLGAAMVTGGYALAFVPHSARYITQEDAAAFARRGMHGHRCAAPWNWQRRLG